MNCVDCGNGKATIKCAKDGRAVCNPCFKQWFEEDVHATISTCSLFKRGERIVIGASGGKDSTVLAFVLQLLNARHDYGVQLVLVSVDEGIAGYRDDSLEAVKRNQADCGMELLIVSYKQLYGWTMDEIVTRIGTKNNCTYCGVFRRQALDRGAQLIRAAKLATGHNADDMAETVLMNMLRGDIARLRRCTQATTGVDGHMPRVKPLKYAFEKDIVMYARVNRLDYFSTECTYAPNSYRNFARNYVKELERIRPRSILDLIRSGESLALKETEEQSELAKCTRCGYLSSQGICKACLLLHGLATNQVNYGVGRVKNKNADKAPETDSGNCSNDCSCSKNAAVIDL